jgi:hypothetical protein
MSKLFLCAEGGHHVQHRIRKATPSDAPSRLSVAPPQIRKHEKEWEGALLELR